MCFDLRDIRRNSHNLTISPHTPRVQRISSEYYGQSRGRGGGGGNCSYPVSPGLNLAIIGAASDLVRTSEMLSTPATLNGEVSPASKHSLQKWYSSRKYRLA